MTIARAIVIWLWINTAGNLVASAITTTLGLWWHHRRLTAKHKAELRQVKEQHAEDLRQTRVHLLAALAETRDHLLKAIGEQRPPIDPQAGGTP